jgi:O-antigen/teichoic acid export membrane protein
VGLYSTAYNLMIVPMFLSSSLTSAYFPALSRALNDTERCQQVSREFLRVLVWIGFPIAAAGWAAGRYAVDLMYGSAYAGSGILFEWLILNIGLVFFNVGLAQPLTAWDCQKIYFKITALAAAANVGLNIILIPRYGAAGAVFTTLLAEFIVAIGALMVRARVVRIPVFRIVYPPLLCSAALAMVVRGAVVFLGLPWWAALALGLSLFAAGFWLLERETILGVLRRIWRVPEKSPQP